MSYLLSTPQIHKIKPSPQLQQRDLNAAQFIKRELTPWLRPQTLGR